MAKKKGFDDAKKFVRSQEYKSLAPVVGNDNNK